MNSVKSAFQITETTPIPSPLRIPISLQLYHSGSALHIPSPPAAILLSHSSSL